MKIVKPICSIAIIKHLSICLLLSTLALPAFCQTHQSINTTGGESSGSGGSSSYSVGQVFSSNNFGTNGSVAEGVQQAYEISIINVIPEAAKITLDFSAFPNPTTDLLFIKNLSEIENDSLTAYLYDLHGKLISSKPISGIITEFDFSTLLPGTYFIKIDNQQQNVKTFKIVKNK